ncbi:hypothetical protein HDU92_002727 [Lobulomyces angularis]|nr:hypothetical protein HDU92_002727 [Lobulomyces angularis]
MSKVIYDKFLKRNSVFILGIFSAGFVFEIISDSITDTIWDRLNKGRQWKDIRHKYVTE